MVKLIKEKPFKEFRAMSLNYKLYVIIGILDTIYFIWDGIQAWL